MHSIIIVQNLPKKCLPLYFLVHALPEKVSSLLWCGIKVLFWLFRCADFPSAFLLSELVGRWSESDSILTFSSSSGGSPHARPLILRERGDGCKKKPIKAIQSLVIITIRSTTTQQHQSLQKNLITKEQKKNTTKDEVVTVDGSGAGVGRGGGALLRRLRPGPGLPRLRRPPRRLRRRQGARLREEARRLWARP